MGEIISQDVSGRLKRSLGHYTDLTSLTSQLAQKAQQADLNTTNTNVSLKADKTYTDTQLSLKRDKSVLVTMNDVAQDVKTAMTGGSVAVVGKRGTTKDNLANDVYTQTLPLKYFTLQGQTYKNLLDYNTFDSAHYYNASGALITGGGYGNYGFVAVSPSTQYIGNATNQYICFYDSSQTFISGTSAVNTFTTTSNCAYVIISRPTTGSSTTSPILHKGTALVTPLDYLEGDGTFLIPSNRFKTEEFETFFTNYFTMSVNLLNISAATTGYYVSYTTGNLVGSSGYRASEYIAVTAGLTYNYGINVSTVDGQQIAWYDANKTFISGVQTSANMVAPANAAYVRITIQETRINTLMFVQGTLPTSYVAYGSTIKQSVLPNYTPNRNSSLIMYTIGDSLTYMGYWQPIVKDRLGINSYTNLGIGGATLTQGSNTILSQLSSLTASANIITVWGGTNDYGGSVPIGTITDTDTSTVYGALNSIINTICTNYPNAKLVVMTPLQRFEKIGLNSINLSLEDYVNAILAVCKKYSIPCKDLYHEGGINQYNQANYLGDQLHINSGNGAQLVGAEIANKISSII